MSPQRGSEIERSIKRGLRVKSGLQATSPPPIMDVGEIAGVCYVSDGAFCCGPWTRTQRPITHLHLDKVEKTTLLINCSGVMLMH